MRVLIVENDRGVSKSLENQLRSAFDDIQIIWAETLVVAMEVANLGDGFDALVIDLNLKESTSPRMVADTAKPLMEKLPTIIISDWPEGGDHQNQEQEELEEYCIEAGAQEFINKENISELSLGRAIRHAILRQGMLVKLRKEIEELRELSSKLMAAVESLRGSMAKSQEN